MATRAPGYFHALDGRLRIGIAGLKRSPETAARIEAELSVFAGITGVSANPKTGNVLILYDPVAIEQHQILDALHSMGYLEQPPEPAYAVGGTGGDGERFERLSRHIAATLVNFALERAVEAIIF